MQFNIDAFEDGYGFEFVKEVLTRPVDKDQKPDDVTMVIEIN